jgi:signal transduction histidine kinase/ActR/RegA family two-component response regulator
MEIENYTKELLKLVTECLNEIILNDDLKSIMHFIIIRLVKITNNKFGFIGEIITDRFGKSFLRQQTLINYNNSFGEDNDTDNIIYNDLDSYDYEPLFDLIYSKKEIIISNDVENDIRRNENKINENKIKLKKFIGIPLIYRDEVISILVLGNYDGNYDIKYLELIKPFIPLINNIIISYQKKISIIYQKNLFISNMSHEVRTPLNGIVGMGQILIDTELKDEQKKMVHIINKCSLQLLSFINDLLDFSHISDGKINFEIKEFNIDDCLKSAIELFQLEINEKKITLNIIYDDKLPKKIIHDRQRIQQIMVNLISNAVKFCDIDGKIDIYLKLEKNISDNEIIFHFSIIDNGCGILQIDLDKMKKNLINQNEMSFTNNFGLGYGYGNGLGLPISKFLITKMNGFFDIISDINTGTSISVKIPVKYNNENTKINNNQVLIISNNLEKRINVVENVIKNGLLPIPVNTIDEGNIYINNANTNFSIIILLIDTLEDLNKTLEINEKNKKGLTDVNIIGEQKYIIYKLINNCKKNNINSELFLFYNKKINYDLSVFDMIYNKFDIDLFYNKQIKKILTNKNLYNNHHNNIPIKKFNINLDSLKILSVEDNFSNQKVITTMLNEIGISSNLITNLFDGIKFIENLEKDNIYDIVFIDLKMPRLNGIEAVKEIQLKNLKKKSFYVAITATVTEDTIKECFKVGMDAFIPKPIQINDLINIISIIIKKNNLDNSTNFFLTDI